MHVGCGHVDIQSIVFRESVRPPGKTEAPSHTVTHVALLARLHGLGPAVFSSPAQGSTTPSAPAPEVGAASPSHHHCLASSGVSLLLLPLVLSCCFPGGGRIKLELLRMVDMAIPAVNISPPQPHHTFKCPPSQLRHQQSSCNAGDPGSISGLGRSPGEGNDNPLQYSSLGNSMNKGVLWDTVHGVAIISL